MRAFKAHLMTPSARKSVEPFWLENSKSDLGSRKRGSDGSFYKAHEARREEGNEGALREWERRWECSSRVQITPPAGRLLQMLVN